MNDLQSSFSECLAWWALTFFIGIAFREFSRDAVGRWIGRASVATSCFVLISFCQFATHQCQVQYQITAAKPAKEISETHMVSQVFIETSKGNLLKGESNGVRITGGRRMDRRTPIKTPELSDIR